MLEEAIRLSFPLGFPAVHNLVKSIQIVSGLAELQAESTVLSAGIVLRH